MNQKLRTNLEGFHESQYLQHQSTVRDANPFSPLNDPNCCPRALSTCN